VGKYKRITRRITRGEAKAIAGKRVIDGVTPANSIAHIAVATNYLCGVFDVIDVADVDAIVEASSWGQDNVTTIESVLEVITAEFAKGRAGDGVQRIIRGGAVAEERGVRADH
jgi:hypothetical protein